MEILLPNFTPAQAEQVYAAALQKCRALAEHEVAHTVVTVKAAAS